MLLSDQSSSLRLAVTGYQYPLARDPGQRFSWHMLEGDVQSTLGSWRFRYPALTCEETPMVAMWLTAVADWLGDEEHSLAPTALEFTEPNVRFSIAERHGDHVTLAVDLAQEFRPPWQRASGESPYTLELDLDVIALRRAATAWTSESRAYPDELDPFFGTATRADEA